MGNFVIVGTPSKSKVSGPESSDDTTSPTTSTEVAHDRFAARFARYVWAYYF